MSVAFNLSELSKSRDCLRGHGPMTRQQGIWVLQQVQRTATGTPGDLATTGKLLTLEAHECPVCGYVELVSER